MPATDTEYGIDRHPDRASRNGGNRVVTVLIELLRGDDTARVDAGFDAFDGQRIAESEQPGCSAKIAISEYAADETVKVVSVVPVRFVSRFVTPPTRSALVALSTRAFVVVDESLIVTSEVAACAPLCEPQTSES